MNHKAATVY